MIVGSASQIAPLTIHSDCCCCFETMSLTGNQHDFVSLQVVMLDQHLNRVFDGRWPRLLIAS